MNEAKLYPDVVRWLERYLKGRHSHSEVQAFDTHKTRLSKLIFGQNIQDYFPEYNAFDIKVDVIAIIKTRGKIKLAFVECKVKPITLKDVGQIWGYSRVAKPEFSFIISPEGISSPLNALISTYGREDVLEYFEGRKIKIAKWNLARREVDSDSILPLG